MKTNETYLPLKQTSVGPFFKSTLAEIYFIIYNYYMEQPNRKPYEAPIALVVEVTTEGTILVASVDQYESIPW